MPSSPWSRRGMHPELGIHKKGGTTMLTHLRIQRNRSTSLGKLARLGVSNVLLAILLVGQPVSAANGIVFTDIDSTATDSLNNSEAHAVNNSGQVVGYFSGTSGPSQAFVWTATGGLTKLGTLSPTRGSSATDINNLGQVVGVSSVPDGAHAFFWSQGTGM